MNEQAPAVPEWLIAAAQYRRNGWRDVLPLPAGQKAPPPTGHTGYGGTEVTDPELAAWSVESGYGNLGLRLPAGIIGIDVDAYGEKPGQRTIAERERAWGKLPDTWRITSRWPDDGDSGIRLFRVPEGLAWNNPGPGVEALHVGWRYAVTWPSIHPNGRRYCWIDESTGMVEAAVPDVRPEQLPALPQAWIDGLSTGPAVERARGDAGEVPAAWMLPGSCLRVTKQLAAGLAALESPDGESRHDVMLRVVLTLVGFGARGHAGVGNALTVLERAFIDAIEPVRGRAAHSEWQRIVEGAVALVIVEPEVVEHCGGPDCDALTPKPLSDELVALAAATSPMLPSATVSGATVAEGSPSILDDPAMKEAWDDFVVTKLPVVDWHALWADDSQEEWIIEPLLPARRLVALYSQPKVGKSLLLLEMAAAIAKGNCEVLGTILGPSRVVLYVDFENDPKADVRERLTAMGYGPDDLANLRYLSFPTLNHLDTEQGSVELMAAVRFHGAEVVVVDTVSRSIGGDENENDTWLSFYRHTGLKMKQAQVALIRLDHAGKDEAKGQRGGSAKASDVDAVWRMSKVTETVFKLECEMNRMPVLEKTLTLHREEDPDLRHRVDAKGLGAAYRAELEQWTRVLSEHGLLYGPERGGVGIQAAFKKLKALADAGAIEKCPPRRWITKVREAVDNQPRAFEIGAE